MTENCKTASRNLFWIKICTYLAQEECNILVLGLVRYVHLDFGNALFTGLPKVDIQSPQRVQNVAANIVGRRTKYDV